MADTNSNFNSTGSNFNSTGRESGRDISSMASNATNQAADMASDAAERVSNVASRVQQKVTDYVRSHDASDMLEDLNSYVKQYPTQAVVAAMAFGFLAAALLRRR
jgi:ElaB/YqjD/DUF883 family membrane-anchored ribosome-binding protein